MGQGRRCANRGQIQGDRSLGSTALEVQAEEELTEESEREGITKDIREAKETAFLKKAMNGVNILAERFNQIRKADYGGLLHFQERGGKKELRDRPSQGWDRDLGLCAS